MPSDPIFLYSEVVADASTGRAVPRARVALTSYPDDAPAGLYLVDGTPVAAGYVESAANGRFQLYAPAGRYNLYVNGELQLEALSIGEVAGVLTGLMNPIYADAGSAPQTVNLPAVAGAVETVVVKKDASANKVTVAAFAGETVLGQASVELTVPGESLRLLPHGTNWYRV